MLLNAAVLRPGRGNQEISSVLLPLFFAPYDFTRAITGDMAELTMLLPPGSESHSFEPDTSITLLKFRTCDVFFVFWRRFPTHGWKVYWSLWIPAGMEIITLMDCVDVV